MGINNCSGELMCPLKDLRSPVKKGFDPKSLDNYGVPK